MTSAHCSSPSAPVVTSLTIQATHPLPAREQTREYPSGAYTPNLAAVPLHIHVDCISADVRDTLGEHQAQIGKRWAPLDVPLAGHRYRAMRVMGEQLGQADPFKLLADGVPGAREDMKQHTLVVTGATFADSQPGFIILDGRADLAVGDRGRGEDLQDHACALAGP